MSLWHASTAAVPGSAVESSPEAGPDAMLTREDIGRNGARLSAGNRLSAISLCTDAALKSPTIAIKNNQISVVPLRNVPSSIYAERAHRSCECVVNALEDRTNAVEFKLAIATIKRHPPIAWISAINTHADYQQAALQLGISKRDFARHSQEVLEAFRSTIRFCADREADR
jgi:hypothetical protein